MTRTSEQWVKIKKIVELFPSVIIYLSKWMIITRIYNKITIVMVIIITISFVSQYKYGV